jgi:hypothetical protein
MFEVVSSENGLPYFFDVSISGTSPGLAVPPPIGVTIPLNPPWLNFDLAHLLPPGTMVNFLGLVPPGNHAYPILNIPAIPSLIGLNLTSLFLILDPGDPGLITKISIPRTTLVVGRPPQIDAVAPATCPQSGGATLTITGSHFQVGANVLVDGIQATGILVNPSMITATAPAGALGPANVVVVNPDTLSDTAVAAIQYVLDLGVGAVTPVVAAGGVATISGAGFQSGLQLFVGGAAVVPSSVLPASVTFAIPTGVPCDTTVTVINPDLQIGSVGWNPSPSISQPINMQGSANGGGSFFLLGDFSPGTTITVGGTPAFLVGMTSTALLAVAPAGTPGIAPVVVSSAAGCTTTTTYLYQ